MAEEIEIPLFPLNVVLFPYSRVPLYIFEERYKEMINGCLNNETVFGVNLFADKKIFTVGCTALVDKPVNRFKGGEMNIIVKGIQRFRIKEYELGPKRYYIGIIEFMDDDNLNFDNLKREKAVLNYHDLINLVYKGTVKRINLNDTRWHDGKRSVAYAIAEKSGLSLIERQTLLETDIEDKRLDFLLKYFDEVLPKLKEAERISNIIKSDGYIQE